MSKRRRGGKYPAGAPSKPNSRKGKTNAVRKSALVVALVIVALAAGIFASYGLSYKPVVDFTFGGNGDLRQSYQLTAMSRLEPSTIDITHILVRNTGTSGISVLVTMHALNAVISSGYYGPYSDSANIQMYLPAGIGYQVVTFYLTLPQQVSTFTIRVTIGQLISFSSAASLATSSLASIQPLSPTTLVYSQTPASPVSYQLSEQY